MQPRRATTLAALLALLALSGGARARPHYGSYRGGGYGQDRQPSPTLPEAFATGQADPYELLRLSRNARLEEVRPAYRRAAIQSHPDKTGDSAAFLLVKEAFDVLSNPELRREYDRMHRTKAFVKRPRARAWSASDWVPGASWETGLWTGAVALLALWLVWPKGASPARRRAAAGKQQPMGEPPSPQVSASVRRSARLLARSTLMFEDGMLPAAGTPSCLGRFVLVVMTEEDASSECAWAWVQKAADAIRPEMRVVWGTTSPASCGSGLVAELSASRGLSPGTPYAMSVQLRRGQVVTAVKPLDAGLLNGQWAAGPGLLSWCERVVGGEVRHLAA